MDEGVTLADPQRVDVRGELVCGRDVAIDVFSSRASFIAGGF
jgi:bifunctional UDP-N-acetylglucosamine pyrophosphorylase/glucosamine-1-phosphate N-acetyltransferase